MDVKTISKSLLGLLGLARKETRSSSLTDLASHHLIHLNHITQEFRIQKNGQRQQSTQNKNQPLGWLVLSEIFPLEIRSAAQSILVNMVFTFMVAWVFFNMLCHMKFGLFLFFTFFVLAMSIFNYFFLPKTKDIPIEEMGMVWKKHWYWFRFVSDNYVSKGGIEMGYGR